MPTDELVAVSYAEGRYEDYDNTNFIPGRLYYLTDIHGKTYIYLNGKQYTSNEVSGSIEWKDILN